MPTPGEVYLVWSLVQDTFLGGDLYLRRDDARSALPIKLNVVFKKLFEFGSYFVGMVEIGVDS